MQRTINLLAESNVVEFFFDRAMEAFTDAIGLGMFGFGSGVIDIFNGQIELIFMVLDRTAVFGASVGQDPQQANLLFFKPG